VTLTRRATIDDVAAHAGVSRSTASRVLNKEAAVAPGTRARVEQAIREMHYRPNRHAAGLARGTSRSIGIVVPRLDRWYFAAVTAAVLSALQDSDHDLLVHAADDRAANDGYFGATEAIEARFDGLVLVGIHLEARQAAALDDAGVRVVSVGHVTGIFPSVRVDDAAVARLATEHVANLGHRRIGLVGISSPTDRVLLAAQAREQSFRATMADLDLAVDETLVTAAESTVAGGIDAGHRLLTGPDPPTAVVTMSDELGFGVLKGARDLGVDVPAQLSVCGIDDHPAAVAAGLTTIAQPAGALGALAAQLLGDVIRGELDEPVDLVVPVDLIVRESTGPGPGRR